MATKVWIGTDGDWSVSGNWSASGIPVDGDTVIVPDGAAALTTNLDRSADGAGAGLNLAYFFSSSKMANPLGSSGTPMQFTADKIRLEGTGTAYFTSNTGTAGDTTDHVEIKSDNLIDAAVLDDTTTAQLQILTFIKGGIQVNAAVNTLPKVNMLFDHDPHSDVNATFTNSSTITSLRMTGGKLNLNEVTLTGGTISGGTVTHAGTKGAVIVHQTGGTYIWNVLKVDSAVSNLVLMGGTFDTTRTAGEKEILDLTLFPTGNLVSNTDLHLGGTPGIPLGQ